MLVGDAAAFMDPFYSPGMDWISFTASRAADLITHARRGEPLAEKIALHNRDFATSHAQWFEAVYKDKYEYMGECDLMSMAFTLDLGFYYLGIASQPFKVGAQALLIPPFSERVSQPFYHLMRTYNRRFAKIARHRRRTQTLGRSNRGRLHLIPGFTLKATDVGQLVKALRRWLWLELTEGWRSWGDPAEADGKFPAAELKTEPSR